MRLHRTLTPIVFILCLLVWPALVHADLQAGVDAYDRGDYATALKEWRPLAEQGDATAQFTLGVMYGYGQGVPQDYVQAHMWFNLAAAQNNEEGVTKLRDYLNEKMTPEQIAEAQRLAREWEAQRRAEPVPENAHRKILGTGWECNRGYIRFREGCHKINIPKNATLDSSGHRWTCNRGYRKTGNQCLKAKVPPNAKLNYSGNGWTCINGFIESDDSCVAKKTASDDEIRQLIIGRSIASYPGNCPCPYFSDRAGRSCGRRSAYSRPGGYSPICYKSDISDQHVKTFREQYEK